MFAILSPYLEKDAKETNIIAFPWEEKLVEQLTAEQEIEMLNQQAASEAFFLRWDQRKAGKA